VGVQTASNHFQHITIKFDEIGKMHGYLTGTDSEAQRTIPKYAKKNQKN